MHRGAHGDELHRARRPVVSTLRDAHADDCIGRGCSGLLQQAAERKTALSRAVVKADSAVAKTLTREDLAFLFADPE